MKEKEDSFIGVQFTTPKGGILTAKQINTKGKDPRYICECSLCSEDKELFPYGSIVGSRSRLINGGCPCGCGRNPRWSEEQNIVRVTRKCKERGYTFHGWYGEYKGSRKTYLDLYNPETNNRWKTATIDNFLRGMGDPLEGINNRRKLRTKDVKYHVNCFREAGFSDGYNFWKSDRKNNKGWCNHWNYTCPACSNDEYVKAGVCTGVFESTRNNLRAGKKACRCSKSYRWTQEQREYQIKKVCEEEGLTFVGWRGQYKNSNSKFNWLCEKNHNCSTSIDKFLSGRRCKDCGILKTKENSQGNGYGYYPDRVNEKDYLYILNFNGRYIKVGRSFNLHQRFNQLAIKSKIAREDTKILKIYTSNHQIVYDTEQWLHSELRERGFEYNESDGLWSTELFDLDCIDVLNYLLKQTDLDICEDNNLN